MPGNRVGTSNQRVGSPTGHFSGRAIIIWGITLCLGALEFWFILAYYEGSSSTLLNGFLLFVAAAVLAFLFRFCLAYTRMAKAWQYRGAFLVSTFLPLFPASWLMVNQWHLNGFARLLGLCLVSAGGAFLGALAATSIHESLWEDNAPPPQAIQDQVLQVHRAMIGSQFSDPPSKRIFDIVLALVGLLVSAPIWLVGIFLIWFEDPGPVLFVKNSVKRGGKNFHQFKLRSMQHGAEQNTGPVLALEEDERVLWIGRILRKTALDELPQLVNILTGDMSFVGPRPQRTVLVVGYLKTMPEYAERHRVRPGLAGLAQIAGDYYLTPRQKLRFDRLYIRHMSLGYDLKLIALAFLITFWYRWQKDWNGRLPRRLLRFGSPAAKD